MSVAIGADVESANKKDGAAAGARSIEAADHVFPTDDDRVVATGTGDERLAPPGDEREK